MALHKSKAAIGLLLLLLTPAVLVIMGRHESSGRLLLRRITLLHDPLHDEGARITAISTSFDLEWHGNSGLSILRSLHQVFSLLFLSLRFQIIFLRLSFLAFTNSFRLLLLFFGSVGLFVVNVIESSDSSKDITLDILEVAF